MLDRAGCGSGFSDNLEGTHMSYHDQEIAGPSGAIHGEPSTTITRARMEAAVNRLPRFTRDVFLAHCVQGLNYPAIAARTGISVRRVEREIARALVGLDRALTEPPRSGWW